MLIILLVFFCGLLYAESYKTYDGRVNIPVVTDSLGDSTTVSGHFGAWKTEGYSTVNLEVKVNNATPAYAGMGNLDSVWLQLYTFNDLSQTLVLLDSVSDAGLPYTYTYHLHSNVGDTAIRNNLVLYYQFYDSLGDTTLSLNYPVDYFIKLK